MTAAFPTIGAVCFDLDGLIFNTEHVFFEAGGKVLAKRGHTMTIEVMDVIIGRRPLESFKLLVDHLQLADDPHELWMESRDVFDAMLETRLETMPWVPEFIARVEALGLPMGVATSSPRDYLERLLGRFDLLDRFQITLTSEDVTFGKPHPEIYQKAAALLGVAPENMLVLEDSAAGTAAAAAAGAYIVSVPHEFTANHVFTGARHIAQGLGDPLLERILTSGRG